MTFTHLDANLNPAMVDVGNKTPTQRSATAEARVRFPSAVASALRAAGLRSPKGPVFDTAIIAGVMGAKRTHELIPFCHPLGLENCRITIDLVDDAAVIVCTVSVHHKTGVEMEALTGATIAALTVYDMCKALSHDIVIGDVRLLAKHGGKNSHAAGQAAIPEHRAPSAPPVHGLILAGGTSSRMLEDKAALRYRGKSQLDRAFDLARRHVSPVFVSVRADQTADPTRAPLPMIVDSSEGHGPIVGIRSAFAETPDVAWLVLACDLPFLSDGALAQLLRERDPACLATAFRSAHDGLPEPLCAVWEPAAAAALAAYQAGGGRCPRKFLMRHPVRLLEPLDRRALDNVNTPDEYAQALTALDAAAGGAP